MRIVEEIVRFGLGERCFGVISRPVEQAPSVGVLLLNAGLIHRVGPSRMYVQLARELAAEGYLACRVDLGGIGDSQGTSPNAPSDWAVDDVRTAISVLCAQHEVCHFALVGICYGADVAFRTASVDDRITHLVLVNGVLLPPTALELQKSRLEHSAQMRFFLRKLKRPQNWLSLILRAYEAGKLKSKLVRSVLSLRRTLTQREDKNDAPNELLAAFSELQDRLRGLHMRSCRVSPIYSELSSTFDVYRLLLRPYFSDLQINPQLLPDGDHAFLSWSAQQELIRCIRLDFRTRQG